MAAVQATSPRGYYGQPGEPPRSVRNLIELQATARTRMHPVNWTFLMSYVEDGKAFRRNLDAYDRWQIRQRFLRAVSKIDTSVELLGQRFTSPIGIAPVSWLSIFRPNEEIEAATAAAKAGVLYTSAWPPVRAPPR